MNSHSQDSPEQGVLYLLRLLLEKIKEFEFDPTQTTRPTIYLNILDALGWCAQETLPYHFPNVISNDQLYGSDPKFINEINDICSGIVEELLAELKTLSDKPKLQGSLALELFERVTTAADLRDDQMFQLAIKLWNLSIKSRHLVDLKVHNKVLTRVGGMQSSWKSQNYRHRLDELLSRMRSKL